jgi:hypothetical protein
MDWSLAAAFFCGLGDDEFFEFVLFDCSLGAWVGASLLLRP